MLVTTNHLDDLREKCESMDKETKDAAIAESRQFAQALVTEQSLSFSQSLQRAVCAVETKLQSSLEQLQSRVEHVLSLAQQAVPRADLERVLSELRSEISTDVATGRREAGSSVTALSASLEALQSVVSRNKAALDTIEARQEAKNRDHVERVEALECEIHKELGQQIGVAKEQLSRARSDLSLKLEDENAKMSALGQRFCKVERQVLALEADAERLGSLPTRRVEWLISQASALASGAACPSGRPGRACASWSSPKFSAAGHGGLQLELRLEGGPDEAGECTLQLWGCEGLQALVKLYVGTAVEELQHSFGRHAPCRMRRCPWRHALDRNEDTLRVGVEILEAFRLSEWPLVPLSPAPGGDPALRQGRGQEGAPVGSLRTHSHLNPSAVDRVCFLQEQWDSLRARMVGRVEWRLEQVLLLQQAFPKGECLCSTVFSAAGAEQLQLVFYPSGDEDARPSYCSFYLLCPRTTVLQCWLSAGKQRREVQRLRSKPNLLGRSNFCLFEGCMDRGSDSLTLVLEIAEAQQHAGALKPTPQLVPWPAFFESSTSCDPDSGRDRSWPVVHEELMTSNSKLQGTPGRISLEDVKQLPAVWTSKPAAGLPVLAPCQLPPVWYYKPHPPSSQGRMPEGYASLGELRGLASEGPMSPSSPSGSCGSPRRARRGDCRASRSGNASTRPTGRSSQNSARLSEGALSLPAAKPPDATCEGAPKL